MNPLSLAGLGIGILGGIGQAVGRGKANKQMNALLGEDPSYSANPISENRLALAKILLGARMPGAAYAEQSIRGAQANQDNFVSRNATDASQELAITSANLGTTDNAFNNLEEQDAKDFQRRYSNLDNAEEGMISEDDKVYNDSVRRFGDKVQIRGAQNENRQNNWQSVSNFGFGLADFGLGGNYKKKQQSSNGTNPDGSPHW